MKKTKITFDDKVAMLRYFPIYGRNLQFWNIKTDTSQENVIMWNLLQMFVIIGHPVAFKWKDKCVIYLMFPFLSAWAPEISVQNPERIKSSSLFFISGVKSFLQTCAVSTEAFILLHAHLDTHLHTDTLQQTCTRMKVGEAKNKGELFFFFENENGKSLELSSLSTPWFMFSFFSQNEVRWGTADLHSWQTRHRRSFSPVIQKCCFLKKKYIYIEKKRLKHCLKLKQNIDRKLHIS